MSYVSREIHTI